MGNILDMWEMTKICGKYGFNMWEVAQICGKRLKYVRNDSDKWEIASLLFKGGSLAGSAGQGFTTARLAIPDTVCPLPTFTQPSHEPCLCGS